MVRPTTGARALAPAAYLLMITFRLWLVEIPVAAVNGFVLMDRVYAPRVGALTAHQIGMSTRIVSFSPTSSPRSWSSRRFVGLARGHWAECCGNAPLPRPHASGRPRRPPGWLRLAT